MAKKKLLGGSLQDQLKAAGLVTGKQVRKAKNGIHRQEMRARHGAGEDDTRAAVRQAQQAKQEQDRLRNLQILKAAETKALRAQVKQLIEMNSQRQPGDVEYHFTEDKKVKKIRISALNKNHLNNGQLAIVKRPTVDQTDVYDLVPEQVARKIMSRDASWVMYLYERTEDDIDEDDPYKDFKIPDDLEW
ncbi:MAG: DUF2058 domain-containing protein [Proteobacteria bacterium]|nr:DUF2058 domain-containing protein [Pseudomonadota bacterium]MDA1298924.1 DUF2058 domain-containing protein [Pseudomonadota bacterium]